MSDSGYTDPRTIVAIISAAVAVTSAVISAYLSVKSRKVSETSVEIARFNAMQSDNARLYAWAKDAIDTISDAYMLLYLPPTDEFAKKRAACLTKLTSLIDCGRLLLPNTDHEKFGANKESAKTGLRQPPMDDLVLVYRLLSESDAIMHDTTSLKQVAQAVKKAKRHFTSAIQDKLEPRVVQAALEKIRSGIK